MECKVQKQQCMNHGDLHSPPHFVIPFEIFPAAAARAATLNFLKFTQLSKFTQKKQRNFSPSTLQKLLERGVIIILANDDECA